MDLEHEDNQDTSLTVYYDGNCRLCRAFARSNSEHLDFQNIHVAQLPSQIDPHRAQREIHVIDNQNRVWRNIAAIVKIWEHQGRHPILRKILRLPPVGAIGMLIYRVVANLRSIIK